MCYSILTLWMPCCCCCCCIVMRWEGDPVILVLLELVDIPANGILPAERCWTPWWEPNCSVLSKEGKSSSRCICIPSPGPIWLMWLKLDGAEIILERRSLFLYILRKNKLIKSEDFSRKILKWRTLVLKFDCFPGRRIASESLADYFQLGSAHLVLFHFPGRWRHHKLKSTIFNHQYV